MAESDPRGDGCGEAEGEEELSGVGGGVRSLAAMDSAGDEVERPLR